MGEDADNHPLSTSIRKIDALISYYFHIPFPELLDDDVWMEKFRQIEWLADMGILGSKQGESKTTFNANNE